MKGNLGHSMKPRVLCFKHFKHLLPQAKASAVVKNRRGMLKKIIVKKKEEGGVDSVFTSGSQRNDKYRASEALYIVTSFIFRKLVAGVTNTIYCPFGLHTDT